MKLIYIFFIFLLSTNLFSQDNSKFLYKNVPNSYVNYESITENYLLSDKSYKIKLSKQSDDYTEEIQNAINKYSQVVLPNSEIIINEKGLRLKNNSVLIFDSKSKLIMNANALEKYALIHIENISNVKIINANLLGDRASHRSNKGEWGMGIKISSSKNVEILNPIISSFWGDGIYIGRINSTHPENIIIRGGKIDNNRRNGISLISGKNINIGNILLSNTNGTAPMAGIDIEPNNNEDILENIKFNNLTTYNNSGKGIAFILLNHVGVRSKSISILLNGHKDFYSQTALFIGGMKNSYKYPNKKLSGYIRLNNLTWNNSNSPLTIGSNFKWAPLYSIANVSVKNNGKEHIKGRSEIRAKFVNRGQIYK